MRHPRGAVNNSPGTASETIPAGRWLGAPLDFARRQYARARRQASLFRKERVRRRHVGRILKRAYQIEAEVAELEPTSDRAAPVVFFNATSTPGYVSFTQLIGLLTSWALRMGGQSIVHWVCQGGMLKCPQGPYRKHADASPPCRACVRTRSELCPPPVREYFELDTSYGQRLPLVNESTAIEELMGLRYQDYDLGQLCLPSLRHTLRRHNLIDDQATRRIYRDFLFSAANIVDQFTEFVSRVHPSALVAFNGLTYPEAVTRQVAMRHGMPVFTYEVGFHSLSAFVSPGLAPSYPLELPADFALNPQQQQQLDEYLEQRLAGAFTMGGIRFWPDMKSLDGCIRDRLGRYSQAVSIFTNSVFDTSQVSANIIFPSMFDWLEATLRLADEHPDTLFVVRAHPDEYRGVVPRSRELVGDWLEERGFLERQNVAFIPPTERISSYELVRNSKVCLVYNSTIGLEAAMLGIPVVCGGQSKYQSLSFLPSLRDQGEYLEQVSGLLGRETIDFPQAWRDEARRFFYYLFFKASLSLARFVEPDEEIPGAVVLRDFAATELRPDASPEMRAIFDGIVNGGSFFS